MKNTSECVRSYHVAKPDLQLAMQCAGKRADVRHGGGATRSFPKFEDAEEFRGDPTVGSCTKIWTRAQRSKMEEVPQMLRRKSSDAGQSKRRRARSSCRGIKDDKRTLWLWNHFGFLRFPGNGKEFSSKIVCMVFRINFAFYNRISSNHSTSPSRLSSDELSHWKSRFCNFSIINPIEVG